jgi:hypothetical protein
MNKEKTDIEPNHNYLIPFIIAVICSVISAIMIPNGFSSQGPGPLIGGVIAGIFALICWFSFAIAFKVEIIVRAMEIFYGRERAIKSEPIKTKNDREIK